MEVEGGGGRRKCALLVGLPSSALSLSLMKKKRERDEGMVDRGRRTQQRKWWWEGEKKMGVEFRFL